MELRIDLESLKKSCLFLEEYVCLQMINEGIDPQKIKIGFAEYTNMYETLEINMWVKPTEDGYILREKGRELFKKDGLETSINIVLSYLNEKTNKKFSLSSQPNRKFVRGRLEEGYTVEELKKVIDTMVDKWKYDFKMSPYLRPETLFNSTKFQGYYNLIPVEEQKRITAR